MRNQLLLLWWFLTFGLVAMTLIGPRVGLESIPWAGLFALGLVGAWSVLTVGLLMTRRRSGPEAGEPPTESSGGGSAEPN